MHTKFAQAMMKGASASPAPDRLEMWAKIASREFIQSGVPLNDSISKLASENDLNPNFIERVCEMANMATHNETLPADPEKRAGFSFPLADAKTIVIGLRSPEAGPKISPEYACPPSGIPSGSATLNDVFGGDGKPVHSGGDIPIKQKLIVMIEKGAAAVRRERDRLYKAAMLCETAEKEAIQQIKQAAIRGAKLAGIHNALSQAGYETLSNELMPKVAFILRKMMLITEQEKVAFKAPEELISRDMPVTIINGRHPLMGSMKTLKEYNDNYHSIRPGLLGLEQKVKYMQNKLKEME